MHVLSLLTCCVCVPACTLQCFAPAAARPAHARRAERCECCEHYWLDGLRVDGMSAYIGVQLCPCHFACVPRVCARLLCMLCHGTNGRRLASTRPCQGDISLHSLLCHIADSAKRCVEVRSLARDFVHAGHPQKFRQQVAWSPITTALNLRFSRSKNFCMHWRCSLDSAPAHTYSYRSLCRQLAAPGRHSAGPAAGRLMDRIGLLLAAVAVLLRGAAGAPTIGSALPFTPGGFTSTNLGFSTGQIMPSAAVVFGRSSSGPIYPWAVYPHPAIKPPSGGLLWGFQGDMNVYSANSGRLTIRPVTGSSNAAMLPQVASFLAIPAYNLKWALITTWENATFFGAGSAEKNTVQVCVRACWQHACILGSACMCAACVFCVHAVHAHPPMPTIHALSSPPLRAQMLVAAGEGTRASNTFACFFYERLELPSGLATSPVAALIYNDSNIPSSPTYALPGSGTPSIVSLATSSGGWLNIGQASRPGTWCFTVHDACAASDAGCSNVLPSLSPTCGANAAVQTVTTGGAASTTSYGVCTCNTAFAVAAGESIEVEGCTEALTCTGSPWQVVPNALPFINCSSSTPWGGNCSTTCRSGYVANNVAGAAGLVATCTEGYWTMPDTTPATPPACVRAGEHSKPACAQPASGVRGVPSEHDMLSFDSDLSLSGRVLLLLLLPHCCCEQPRRASACQQAAMPIGQQGATELPSTLHALARAVPASRARRVLAAAAIAHLLSSPRAPQVSLAGCMVVMISVHPGMPHLTAGTLLLQLQSRVACRRLTTPPSPPPATAQPLVAPAVACVPLAWLAMRAQSAARTGSGASRRPAACQVGKDGACKSGRLVTCWTAAKLTCCCCSAAALLLLLHTCVSTVLQ